MKFEVFTGWVVYCFMDNKNQPYYIFYTNNFVLEWKTQSKRAKSTSNHHPHYIFSRELIKRGFDVSLEVLESNIRSEQEAITKTFKWIESYRTKDVRLFNKFFDSDGNEITSSPHKEKRSKEISEASIAFWTPLQKQLHSIKNKGKALGKKRTPEQKKRISEGHKGKKNGRAKKILFISPRGKEYIVEGGMQDFCLKHKLGRTVIRAMLNGRDDRKKYKGWTIKYID